MTLASRLAILMVLTATAGTANAVPEICGNGIDDNMDGLTDEGCAPSIVSNVCESPLSCGTTGMVAWKTGALHYDLPPDENPRVPYGPGIGFRRFYTSMSTPGTNPVAVNKAPLGPHWQHTYLTYLDRFHSTTSPVPLHTPDGRDVMFTPTGTVGKITSYKAQSGFHVLSLTYNDSSHIWTLQLLTGETLIYNAYGQISEIWDTLLPTPNKVLVTWDATTSGNVSTVTDASGKRRLLFTYTTGRLIEVDLQLNNGTWGTVHSVTYNNPGPGGLASATIGGQLAQQFSYDTAGNLSGIADSAGNAIASFSYASATSGQVDRIATTVGTVGFEFNSTRTGCTGNTLLYFNKGNTISCSADADCGTGFFCGGKTGTGATGSCFLAARCLTLGTAGGETVVTNVAALGPGGGSCTGACLDVAQYVWSTVSGVVGVAGRQDPLGNYTSTTYNSDGLPTQIAYGDTDSNPANGGYARTEYFAYDTTIRGRLLEVSHASDLDPSASSCTSAGATGCAGTKYIYNSSTGTLTTFRTYGTTLDATGATFKMSSDINYSYDSQGRVTQVLGAVSGIKTTYDYYTGATDPKLQGFLQDYKAYKDSTNFLQASILAYDYWGNPIAMQAPDGTVSCQTFDAARNVLTQRREAMAGQTDCTTPNAADLTTNWARDSALRLTQLTRPDGSCMFWEYDSFGRLARTKRRDDCNAASSGDREEYLYTVEGLLSEIDTYDTSSTLTRKQPMTYYASRHLKDMVNPVDTTKLTTLIYDAGGMVSEVDDAGGLGKTTYAINGDRRITGETRYKDSVNADTWTFLFSWMGDQSQYTDGDSKSVQSVQDDLGRMVKIVSPDMTGSALHIYDAANRLTQIVEPGTSGARTHTFTYDYLSRILTSDYAGTCLVTGGAQTEITRVYDAPPAGTCPMTGGCNRTAGHLAYVDTILMCSSTYNSTDGALDQKTWYSFDPAGRMSEEYISDDSGRIADQLYQWTKNGALSQVTMPSGAVLGWNYGSTASNSDNDTVSGTWRTSTGTPVTDTVTWFPYGPLRHYNWEATYSGSLQTNLFRNLAYRLTKVQDAQGPGVSNGYYVSLTEDAKGRITSRQYSPHDPILLGLFDSFFLYDQQDRVICETSTSMSTCPTTGSGLKNNLATGGFTHAGDWQSLLRPVPGSTAGLTNQFNPSGYGTSHQVTTVRQNDGTPPLGDTTFGYDVRGERTYDDNTSTLTNDRRDYTYDARHNVVNVRGQYKTGGAWHYYDVASAFDQRNRRVYKSFLDETTTVVATWFFYYDATSRLTEVRYTPNTTSPTTYSVFQLFWLGDLMTLYWQTDYPSATTSKRYALHDESGRIYAMWGWPTAGNALVDVWSINPSAWGFDMNLSGAGVFQPLLFADQYLDLETGALENDGATVHRPGVAVNGQRTYDPFVGGYLDLDPVTLQSRTSYTYVNSNPVGERSSPVTETDLTDLTAHPTACISTTFYAGFRVVGAHLSGNVNSAGLPCGTNQAVARTAPGSPQHSRTHFFSSLNELLSLDVPFHEENDVAVCGEEDVEVDCTSGDANHWSCCLATGAFAHNLVEFPTPDNLPSTCTSYELYGVDVKQSSGALGCGHGQTTTVDIVGQMSNDCNLTPTIIEGTQCDYSVPPPL